MAWFTAAGGTTCVAAYDAVGAVSLADSYTNEANPGTYTAAPGVAPTWAYGAGWDGRMCYNYQRKTTWPGAVAAAPTVSQRSVIPMTVPDDSMTYPQVKACRQCGETKELAAFHRYGTNGWRGVCRECRNGQRRARHAANPELARARDRARQDTKNAAYYAANAERERERSKRYKLTHPGRARATHKAWVSRNRDKVCDYSAARRALERAAHVEHVERALVYQRDGGRCHVCDKKCRPTAFHLDHLMPLSLGGEHSYRNVAVACPSCNVRRRNTGPAQLRLDGGI